MMKGLGQGVQSFKKGMNDPIPEQQPEEQGEEHVEENATEPKQQETAVRPE